MQQTLNIPLFKFNSDFRLCGTDEDGCTVKACGKLKKVVLFLRLSVLLVLISRPQNVVGANYTSKLCLFLMTP